LARAIGTDEESVLLAEPPDSTEDIDHAGIVVPGLIELAPGVRPTSRNDHAPLAGMAFIAGVAVALQDAAEARSENVVQAAPRPARVPLVKARSPRLSRRSRPMNRPKVSRPQAYDYSDFSRRWSLG